MHGGIQALFVIASFIAKANCDKISETSSNFKHLVKEYKISDGRHVFIFDGAISEEHILGLELFMSANDNWRYVLHDPSAAGANRTYDDENGIPWKSWNDPTPLRATRVGSEMKDLVQMVDEKVYSRRKNFEMNEVYAGIIRRGDRTKLHNEGDGGDDSYSVAIFNNIVWRKNGYGELLFYDDDGEIVTSIRPKFARVVVWHSSITYIFRPPSIAQLVTQIITFAQFSSSYIENTQKCTYFQNFVNELHHPPKLSDSLPKIDTENIPINFGRHLTMIRRNRKNHFVAVFDGLFEESALSALRNWVIKYGLYYFDGSLDSESDNVQWIAGISVPDFVKTLFWPVIHQMAVYVSNTTEWYPYDVACNLIRTHDHTRFHLDTSYDAEKEMTFLLYLSPNWTAADYGETAFMETNDDDSENEYVTEVVPMYGRAVIFDGNFPHSARPPSVTHYNARYTFAVKLGFTKKIAVQKALKQEFGHEEGLVYALTEAERLYNMPKSTVVLRKYQAVQEHLKMRVLHKELSGHAVQDDEDEEEMDGFDGSDHDAPITMEKPYDEYDEQKDEMHEKYEEVIESQFSLPDDERLNLQRMEEFYGLREHFLKAREDTESVIDSSPIFSEERKAVLKKWETLASKDPDEFVDFSELYLKQRNWLKDYISNKMINIL